MTSDEAISKIEEYINGEQVHIADQLQNTFVEINGEFHSLEVLFNHYVYQLRNEFSGFEALLPQGYVYTIDPPSIFASAFDAQLMTRLQILAMKQLFANAPPQHLTMIGFNDGGPQGDKGAVALLKAICKGKAYKAVPKIPAIYTLNSQGKPVYQPKQNWALIIHNNSDAFGQNIEYEKGFQSLDAAVGALTTAAPSLHRKRSDLLTCCYPPMKMTE